jgi:hypothetical protein
VLFLFVPFFLPVFEPEFKGIRKWLTATQKLEMNPSVGNIMTNLMIYFVTASTRVEA